MGRKKVELVNEQIVQEETIYDKYRKYIDSVLINNSLTNITYGEVMEIVNHIEKLLNKPVPVTMSCSICLFNIIKLFANLEKMNK